ncbi:MAG: SRPBCC family protein, partial [Chloroflexota bacterium]
MAAFESSIEIDRSVDDVFAFLADPSNETQWQSGLIDSSFTSNGPVAVGTTGRDIRKSMGMKST